MTRPDTDNTNMAALDALLSDAAQDATGVPDAAFMARMTQMALEQQPVPSVPTQPWWRQLQAVLGGWQGMGGLVAATCAGFWIGISPPETVPASLETLLNIDAIYDEAEDSAALVGFGWVLEEG